MPFQKGHTGRPSGIRNKRVFSLPDIVNTMFPTQAPQIASRRSSVASGIKCNGKQLFLDYLDGKRTLTARQSIIANCFDCCGQYIDGRCDCENPLCPCYPFMPYRRKV
jgi:hypothetical protein